MALKILIYSDGLGNSRRFSLKILIAGILNIVLLHSRNSLQTKSETSIPIEQFRSGYCSRLNSYLSRIDPDIPNKCPACNESPHDTTTEPHSSNTHFPIYEKKKEKLGFSCWTLFAHVCDKRISM